MIFSTIRKIFFSFMDLIKKIVVESFFKDSQNSISKSSSVLRYFRSLISKGSSIIRYFQNLISKSSSVLRYFKSLIGKGSSIIRYFQKIFGYSQKKYFFCQTINKIKDKIYLLFFGENYFVQILKNEENNKITYYLNFRNFELEEKIGWISDNNEKVHDSVGSKFKIFIGSSEIIHFSTVREFKEFIWVLNQTLEFPYSLSSEEEKQLNKYLNNINYSLNDLNHCFSFGEFIGFNINDHSKICSLVTNNLGIKYTLYIFSHYLSCLETYISQIDDTSYLFTSKDLLQFLSIDLSNFFISRYEMLYFLSKIIPSYNISSKLIIDIYKEEQVGEYTYETFEVIGYDNRYHVLFIENLNIFINNILKFPFNKLKKKNKSFCETFKSYLFFKLEIKIKFKILFLKILFNENKNIFFKEIIIKNIFFIISVIIFLSVRVLLDGSIYWLFLCVLMIYIVICKKIQNNFIFFSHFYKIYGFKNKILNFWFYNSLKSKIFILIFIIWSYIMFKLNLIGFGLEYTFFFKFMFPVEKGIGPTLTRSSSLLLGSSLIDIMSRKIAPTINLHPSIIGNLKLSLMLKCEESYPFLKLFDKKAEAQNLLRLAKIKPGLIEDKFWYEPLKKGGFSSKSSDWSSVHESLALIELNKRFLNENSQFRRPVKSDSFNFMGYTPDAILSNNFDKMDSNIIRIFDFKKISFPFSKNYIDNFITNQIKIVNNRANNAFPMSIIINLGELPLDEKQDFLIYIQKKIDSGEIEKDIFYIENNQLIVTDIRSFENFIFSYLSSFSLYNNTFDLFNSLSKENIELFESIILKFKERRLLRTALVEKDLSFEIMAVKNYISNNNKYLDEFFYDQIKKSMEDSKNDIILKALPWGV